jgi:Uma2 family endonuclease
VNDLWDGTVLVRPQETPRHQMIVGALTQALRAGRSDLHVMTGVPVRLAPQRIVMPDLVVTGTIDPDRPLIEAPDVRLVVEVSSPASAAMDKTLKMHGYAEAGIPWYLLVEQDTRALHSLALSANGYVERSVMQLESLL